MRKPKPVLAEGARAAHWRQHVMRMEVRALSEATGYSVAAIRSFEANSNSAGELIGPDAWKRYRLVCAAVQGKLGNFNWEGR